MSLTIPKGSAFSAKLKVIAGPMGAGKTTELLNQLTIFAGLYSPHIRVLYINSEKDVRDGVTSSHSGKCSLHPNITGIKVNNLRDADISSFDVIGVDEAQFFQDLYETVTMWLTFPKQIIIAGLSGDIYRRPFGQINSLVQECDEFVLLKARCKPCIDEGLLIDASFTGCTEKISHGEVRIGGWDIYIPMCRNCHDEFLRVKKTPS